MRPNISPTEGDIRGAVLAPLAVLVGVGIGIETVGGLAVLALAVLLFITAITGYCPAYDLFARARNARRHA